MLKNDFLNLCADAIQNHEGWEDGSASARNNNQGNLRFVGQPGATAGPDNFCVFPNVYDGRLALVNDIDFKLDRFTTIREVVSAYAPPSENDTEAYIKAVIDFFAWRNWAITDTMAIEDILKIQQDEVLLVLNQISAPADWHKAQQAISLCASYMPGFGFSVRYSNEDLQDSLVFNPAPGNQTFEGIAGARTQAILARFNEGQEFNLLMYNSGMLNLTGTPAGGEEQMGQAVSFDHLQTSFASVNYHPTFIPLGISCEMFHELIHQLFTITGDPDTLHAYLIAHGGYNLNLLTDLQAVYGPELERYRLKGQIIVKENAVVAFLKILFQKVVKAITK